MSVFGSPQIAYSYGSVGGIGSLSHLSTNPAITAVGSGALAVNKGDLIVVAAAAGTTVNKAPYNVFDSSGGANHFQLAVESDDTINGNFMQWWYCVASQAMAVDYFELDFASPLGHFSNGLIAVWDFPIVEGSAIYDVANGTDSLLDGATAQPGVTTTGNDELVVMLCFPGNDFPTAPPGFTMDRLNVGGFVQWSMAHGLLTAPQTNYAPAFGSVSTSDAWAIMFKGAVIDGFAPCYIGPGLTFYISAGSIGGIDYEAQFVNVPPNTVSYINIDSNGIVQFGPGPSFYPVAIVTSGPLATSGTGSPNAQNIQSILSIQDVRAQ